MNIIRPLFILLSCAIFLSQSALYAQPNVPGEYHVKAAFLYNFAKFVEWPAETFTGSNDLFLCVIGQDPFGESLDHLVAGKLVRGKKISVLRPEKNGNLNRCQILFISSSEKDRLKEIQKEIKQAHILTVGEIDQFAQAGFVINFVLEQNKIRFEINPSAAERMGLKISAQLMKLAIVVQDNPQ